jgi:predicted ABC-type ATPase
VSAPKAILVGGANGAGKTTLARQYLPLLYPGILFLNADEIQNEADEALSSIAAGKELLRRLRSAETLNSSFAVETTLASRMYIPHVQRWNLAGFETILHFIEVPSADFAVARVNERVRRGGHPIPEDAVRRRHQRGLELFVQAYRPLFDLWYHWKSDEQGLKLFATKTAGD